MSRRLAAIASSVTLAVVTGVPGVALACPYCAGRSQGSIWTNVILAIFVSVPFVLAWVVYRVARSGEGVQDAGSRLTASPGSARAPSTFNRSRSQAS